MSKSQTCMVIFVAALCSSSAHGATATFTPMGPTTVSPGTPVQFLVTVSADTLSAFDAADIAIGTNDATGLSFEYSNEWSLAFPITSPLKPLGLYEQDLFVGGNSGDSGGSSIELGIVTVQTDGMTEGTFDVRIDAAIFGSISSLILEGRNEGLAGLGEFQIECAALDPMCDGNLGLDDYLPMSKCVTGPGQDAETTCQRYDARADGKVDLRDLQLFFNQFTGAR